MGKLFSKPVKNEKSMKKKTKQKRTKSKNPTIWKKIASFLGFNDDDDDLDEDLDNSGLYTPPIVNSPSKKDALKVETEMSATSVHVFRSKNKSPPQPNKTPPPPSNVNYNKKNNSNSSLMEGLVASDEHVVPRARKRSRSTSLMTSGFLVKDTENSEIDVNFPEDADLYFEIPREGLLGNMKTALHRKQQIKVYIHNDSTSEIVVKACENMNTPMLNTEVVSKVNSRDPMCVIDIIAPSEHKTLHVHNNSHGSKVTIACIKEKTYHIYRNQIILQDREGFKVTNEVLLKPLLITDKL